LQRIHQPTIKGNKEVKSKHKISIQVGQEIILSSKLKQITYFLIAIMDKAMQCVSDCKEILNKPEESARW
jgi:hypothetical protein